MVRADSLAGAVQALFGEEVRAVGREPVYGGDINRAYRLELSNGEAVFMKCNTPDNRGFFEAETAGLEALRRTGAISVPEPLALGTDAQERMSFLLMEHLPAAPRQERYWEVFGWELAAMHRADCGKQFGFGSDNFIGASVQVNTQKRSWTAFFRDCRLAPQIKMAEGYLDGGMRRRCTRLLDKLDEYLPEPAFPSLLHGDLWSGNVLCGPDGKAWLIDPAVYVGHFEADLAMTELFGGFPAAFYGAYREANYIEKDYRERRELYNLYHLLNHLNLFGPAYYGAVKDILDRYA